VPSPAEGWREPAKRKQIRNLRLRVAGDDEIDQDDLFRRRVNKKHQRKVAAAISQG